MIDEYILENVISDSICPAMSQGMSEGRKDRHNKKTRCNPHTDPIEIESSYRRFPTVWLMAVPPMLLQFVLAVAAGVLATRDIALILEYTTVLPGVTFHVSWS